MMVDEQLSRRAAQRSLWGHHRIRSTTLGERPLFKGAFCLVDIRHKFQDIFRSSRIYGTNENERAVVARHTDQGATAFLYCVENPDLPVEAECHLAATRERDRIGPEVSDKSSLQAAVEFTDGKIYLDHGGQIIASSRSAV